mmetsp:Transcript_20430/g.62198  ORF Transcript_20430/g.62198 Transcript_20430/m.62198 type:complete len:263 (+) Transcript_20430:3183-3971(+)
MKRACSGVNLISFLNCFTRFSNLATRLPSCERNTFNARMVFPSACCWSCFTRHTSCIVRYPHRWNFATLAGRPPGSRPRASCRSASSASSRSHQSSGGCKRTGARCRNRCPRPRRCGSPHASAGSSQCAPSSAPSSPAGWLRSPGPSPARARSGLPRYPGTTSSAADASSSLPARPPPRRRHPRPLLSRCLRSPSALRGWRRRPLHSQPPAARCLPAPPSMPLRREPPLRRFSRRAYSSDSTMRPPAPPSSRRSRCARPCRS